MSFTKEYPLCRIQLIREKWDHNNLLSHLRCIALNISVVSPNALTPRQLEIVELIAAGHSTRSIAVNLGISPLTVRKHRANILAALSLQSAAALAAYAVRSTASGRLRQDDASDPSLTSREREVGDLLLDGMTNKQVARRLGISDLTVRKHRENMYRKLCVTNTSDLLSSITRISEPRPVTEPAERTLAADPRL